jgi:hypothetical protein
MLEESNASRVATIMLEESSASRVATMSSKPWILLSAARSLATDKIASGLVAIGRAVEA